MTVQSVTKMWSKTGGARTSEKADPLDQKWAITEGYQVESEPGDGIDLIDAAMTVEGVNIGVEHPDITGIFCRGISPQQISPIFWQVLIAWEGETATASVDVEWTDVTTTEPVDRDFDGNAIVTDNGEQVEGLTMDVSDQICVIRRKFITVNTASIRQYRRATNSDTFLGWPPGTARLVGYSAKNQFRFQAAQELWDVTARIQFREPYANTTTEEAWYKRWRHEGLYVKDGTVIRRAVDELGQERTKPVLLQDGGEEETDPDAAVFKHTKVYDSLPYSGLGLI